MLRRSALIVFILLATAGAAFAQQPADAVMLDKVKIPEAQKSVDLCPVYLETSDPNLPTWEYKGVTYRGARADAQEKFLKDPDKYARAAERQRFINNFMRAIGPLVFGAVGSAFGLPPVFWINGAMMMIGGLMSRTPAQQRPR